MFGFSGEHLLVLLVILLIFGPKRLPDLGHSLGRTLKNFKDAMNNNGMQGETRTTPTAAPSAQIQAKAGEPSKSEKPAETHAETQA